jgi:hypothetical protein
MIEFKVGGKTRYLLFLELNNFTNKIILENLELIFWVVKNTSKALKILRENL